MKFRFIALIFIAAVFLPVSSLVAQPAPMKGLSSDPNPYDPNTGYNASQGAVQGSGSANSSPGRSDTGASDTGIPIVEEEHTTRAPTRSTFMPGSSEVRSRNAVFFSVPMLQALSTSMYTSPLSVLMASIGLTDSSLLAAFGHAREEADDVASGTHSQEAAYLASLRGLPDERSRRERYFTCKRRYISDPIPRTNFDAMTRCIGGFSTSIPPSNPALGTGVNTQAKPTDEREIPFPIKVEDGLRAGGTATATSLGECFLANLSQSAGVASDDCFRRTLWSYVFHHVVPDQWIPFNGTTDDVTSASAYLANELLKFPANKRWAKEDWARMFFGNVVYEEKPPGWTSGSVSATVGELLLANETNTKDLRVWYVAPKPRLVNFWSPNIQEGIIPGSTPYTDGKFIPMSGYDLLRAQYLQDIYGSMYALEYKMCDHENANTAVLRTNAGGGLGPKCQFWDQPIDTTWVPGSVNIAGLGTTVSGCIGTSPGVIPSVTIFPIPGSEFFDFLWPSQALLSPITGSLSSYFNWGGKRFYEQIGNNTASGFKPIPTFQRLLGNLSGGGVSFSHYDAKVIGDLFRIANPPDSTGIRDCEKDLKDVYLGDIMEWKGPLTAPGFWGFAGSLTEYYTPASSSWPLVERFKEGTALTSPEHLVTKRIQLLYEYANTLAELKTLQTIESFRRELRFEVLSGDRWAEKYDTASQLVARALPGADYRSTASTTMKIQELSMSLRKQREAIYQYYDKLKTYAKLSDQMGGKTNPGVGLATLGGS